MAKQWRPIEDTIEFSGTDSDGNLVMAKCTLEAGGKDMRFEVLGKIARIDFGHDEPLLRMCELVEIDDEEQPQ